MDIMAVLRLIKAIGLVLIGAGLIVYSAEAIIDRRRKNRKS